LLYALAAPGDERRLRAALATPLFGFDAAALCALAEDSDAQRRWQEDFLQWRLRWEQHGPQAVLAEVVARQAPRLLALADGEREATYLLQLGELMQEARAQRLGPQGQLDWLQSAIAHADGEDESQQPRLESDAGRVQILTLHASKGLEFPLVFLPFAGIGRGNGGKAKFVDYHDAAGVRVRQWKTAWVHPGAPDWDSACMRAQDEDRAEDMRLLYVGLTRAREALWLCSGALASNANTALHRLLGAGPSDDLKAILGAQLRLDEGLPTDAPVRVPVSAPPPVPPVREPQRRLRRDWWIHSFSQLHRQRAHGLGAVQDERPLAAFESARAAVDPRFRGQRFGNALHHALEHVDFAAWRDHAGPLPPEGQAQVLIDALESQDYAGDDHADGVRELCALVAATLNAPLPEGGRLCELPPAARIAELEFHYTLDDVEPAALLALLHRHGVVRDRSELGALPRLTGLMTGKIDLTYRNGGRVHVLDYKSNLLPDHDADTLAEAMRASEYDLQALLYVVALHRWLRLRRADYDYARDFGGVRYLFCRGLDRAAPGRGVIAPAFDAGLVHALDALFGGAPGGGAA
jgi:exodeoxyribonuclease V beta subunit